jgi:Tol biopolymer transport system component
MDCIDPLTNRSDLWQFDLSRETRTRVTLNGGNYSPIWAPDGNRVAFISMREGFYGVYQKTLSLADKEELLFNADLRSTWLCDWSRDGRFLVLRKENENTEYDINLLPLFGDRKPRDYVATEFSDGWAKVSPDGHWLAYQSNESGRFEIYVQSFPDQGRKVIISKGGGKLPRWRSDGKELYYVAEDDRLMAALVRTGSSFSAGSPVELFKLGAYDRTAFRYAYEVSPDGQKFLALRPEEEASERPLTVVQNWTELLKK